MDKPINTLMVEGSFDDQILEMAQYIDTRRGAEGLVAELEPLVVKAKAEAETSKKIADASGSFLEKEEKEEALKKIVDASGSLSSSPEKEYIPAYNLLIHLVRNSLELPSLLPTILQNLSTPPPTSPHNGPALSVHALSTIFNVLPANSPLRYPVLRTTLKVVADYGMYETLAPQLKNVEKWVGEWESSVEEIRELYLVIAGIAEKSGDKDQFYQFLFKALQTIPPQEADGAQARELSLRLVKAAINIPSRLEFDDLIALDAVQKLGASDPEAYALLEVFIGGDLEDYEEFNDEHDGWVDDNGIDHPTAFRKIRLLTLASLASSASNRELPYNVIARRLHIPSEEVELWVIDVIRAGLVEGKLSQLNQTFLIHRSTYRSFGKQEWEEVGARLETWKLSLRNILETVRSARESVVDQHGKETAAAEGAVGRINGGRSLEVEG